MKNSSSRTKLHRQIIDEASAWFVEFRVGDIDRDTRTEFSAWLRRSPEHIQAYLEVTATYAAIPSPDPHDKIDVSALIARARASLESNLMLLAPSAQPQQTAEFCDRRAGRTRPWAALAASLFIVSMGVWLYIQRDIYSTAIGEQRSITLADGSTIELNADSRIRLHFTAHERSVELLEGQAQFEVARDRARPFVVRSAGTQVRAIGTLFDVYRKRTGTLVTVIEGRVAVTEDTPGMPDSKRVTKRDEEPIYLAAGEQVTVTRTAISKPAQPNVAATTAWTRRRLVFENAALAEVAEEFNRYNTRPLIIDPSAPLDFHVSGTYSARKPESLVRFLRAQEGIRVTETEREIRVSRE
jgi:transmembrane sensor